MSFTKPTGTPVLGFVSAVTRVPATWFNYVSNNFTSILDGVGGGYYELAGADLEISSDTKGIVINTAGASFPTELRGYVLVGLSDDPDYPLGVGTFTVQSPATFSSSVTFSGAIIYNNTIAFNNVVTFGSGADPVVQNGCAWTWQSGSSATFASGSTLTAQSGSTLQIGGDIVATGDITVSNSIEFDTPATYTRGPSGIFAVTISTTQWLMPTTGTVFNGAYAQGTDVTTGSPLLWIMDVPANATITGAAIFVDPPAGHGGVLPNTPPRIVVYVMTLATGAILEVPDSETFDPTLIGTYEDPHAFATDTLSQLVTDGQIVVMAVYGEYGGSAQPGLKVYPPSITYTRSLIGEE